MSSSIMNSSALLSLLPLILLSIGLLALMLLIAFNRDARLSYWTGLGSLALSFISLFIISGTVPQQATPLLLIDGYALFFIGLILLTALLLLPLCHAYWQRQTQLGEEFYLLYLLAVLGAQVLVCSSHFAGFFLGLELLTLPLIVLIGYPFYRTYSASLEAAIKYLILSAAASATLLFGMALIYSQLGTLEFSALEMNTLSQTATHQPSHPAVLKAGVMLLIIGVAFKLSLAPFHLWAPDVYQGAPLPATAFLATVSKAAVFAVLLRYYLSGEIFRSDSLIEGLALLAIISMLLGNLLALFQPSIKRLLAYSSTAHFGYLLVALLAISEALGSAMAVEAVGYYLVAYLLSTLAAFAVLLSLPELQEATDSPLIDDLRGLFWRQPLPAAILALALLSLAGIPLSVGFIGKFYIFAAAVRESLWGLLLIAVLGSAIGLFYYIRVILVMALRHDEYPATIRPSDDRGHPATGEQAKRNHGFGGGLTTRWVLLTLALLTLLLGIYPTPLITLIRAMTLTMF